MVNMYVLANGNLPSGWTRVTTYDGRYVRFTSSTGQHGVTGGASQHQHLSVATNSGNNTQTDQRENWYGSGSVMHTHSHVIPATYSGYSNNDPAYYTLSLWRIDLATWESDWRCFPAGAVVLSTTAISCTGMSRFTTIDDTLIVLGTPGSSGGRTTHTDHTISVTLSTKSAGISGYQTGGGGSWTYAKPVSHGHTATISSVPSNSILPARVKTRAYLITSETDRAMQNVVCFFDATPTSKWTLLSSWNARFFQCSDSDPTLDGVDTHSHTSGSTTSSSYTAGKYTYNKPYEPANNCAIIHSHPVAVELESASHVPEYVSLCPYYLNTTLLHINSETETWTMDSVLKAVKTTSATMDLRSQGAGSAIMTPDVLVQDTFDNGWYMDMIGQLKDLELTWDTNAQAMIQPWESWSMAVSLLFSHVTWDSNLRLIRPVTANPPVIDTIVKAWADEFNYLHQLITSMEWANKLASATGTELDDKWGSIFEIPRWTGETDDAYRKRLQTYTMIHTSSGTKSNAEAVLDTIVEEAGASSVETCWPATVRVNFSTDSALRMATTYQSLIEYTLGQLIASGISWTMYLPYLDYEMGATFRGQTFIEYESDLLVKLLDKEFAYWLRPRLIVRKTGTWDNDLLLSLVDLEKAWDERTVLKAIFEDGFDIDVLARDTFSTSWTSSIRALRAYTRSFSLGARVMSYDLEEAWTIDARMKRIIRRTVQAITSLILQQTVAADMDAWVKRFGIHELYQLDLNVWVHEQRQFGMTIGMVPAS